MCLKVCHVRLLTKVNESLIPLHKKRNSFPNLIPDMLSLQIHYQQWLHGYSLSFCLRLDEIHLGFQCKGHLFQFPLSCDYLNLSFIFHFYIHVQFIYAYYLKIYVQRIHNIDYILTDAESLNPPHIRHLMRNIQMGL